MYALVYLSSEHLLIHTLPCRVSPLTAECCGRAWRLVCRVPSRDPSKYLALSDPSLTLRHGLVQLLLSHRDLISFVFQHSSLVPFLDQYPYLVAPYQATPEFDWNCRMRQVTALTLCRWRCQIVKNGDRKNEELSATEAPSISPRGIKSTHDWSCIAHHG